MSFRGIMATVVTLIVLWTAYQLSVKYIDPINEQETTQGEISE